MISESLSGACDIEVLLLFEEFPLKVDEKVLIRSTSPPKQESEDSLEWWFIAANER